MMSDMGNQSVDIDLSPFMATDDCQLALSGAPKPPAEPNKKYR
jgi:hypothetical protein